MVERLTATCDAFALAVDVPRRGDREAHVEVIFTPGGTVDSATVEVRLFARKVSGVIRAATHWDTEAAVPGTKALLERGQTGTVRFERPLPPFVTGFRGTGLEIAPAVVVESADGSRLAVLVDAASVAGDARLVVRGLPLEQPLSPGLVRGLRRGPRGHVAVEDARHGSIAITVHADEPVAGGRVSLEALEYERDHGSHFDWAPPITAVEAPLVPIDTKLVRAEIRLPEATTAPASIECTWATRKQGVRWLARIELEDGRGKVTRESVPLHVGVERAS